MVGDLPHISLSGDAFEGMAQHVLKLEVALANTEKLLRKSEQKRAILEGALNNLTRKVMAMHASTPENMAVLRELNANRDENAHTSKGNEELCLACYDEENRK